MSVTSTGHARQAPAGSSSGWSQNRGIWMPSCSAARISKVPLGTEISNPSIVTVTRSSFAGGFWTAVIVLVRSCQDAGSGERTAVVGHVGLVLVAKVLNRGGPRAGRPVAECAERATHDVVGQIEQGVEVGHRAAAVLEPLVDA